MARAAMGASSRPPDIGSGSRPPDQGGLHHSSTASSTTPRDAGTPAWAGARSASGESYIGRPYRQIIEEATSTNSSILLQINLLKIFDKDVPESKPMNLSELHISEQISDVLKIPLSRCIELDSQTGRYEKRELLVSPNTDITNVVTRDTTIKFRHHKIRVSALSNMTTKVTFRGVHISVPNEELIHLCKHYGDPVDGKVNRQTIRLGNDQA